MEMLDGKLDDSVFSFIPNTAEVAFIGMVQELERLCNEKKFLDIKKLN